VAAGARRAGGNNDVPHIAFLTRVRRLFAAPSPHLDIIADAIAQGTLKQPAQPMSDQELTRAIREFQNMPLSKASLTRFGARLAGPKSER
jgi:hypothetical protein